MPPRRAKAAPKGGDNATLRRVLTLFALLAAAAGARFIVGYGIKALGIGVGLGGSAAEQAVKEAPKRPTAAEAKTPQEFVERSIAENRVIVFSKSYCGFSARGKAVMRKHLGEEGVKVVELDQREDTNELQDVLLGITGGRTVPRIFVDGQFIGGADDVTAKDQSGELATLLKEKGLLAA